MVTAAHCFLVKGKPQYEDYYDDITITLGRSHAWPLSNIQSLLTSGVANIENDEGRFQVKAKRNIRISHFQYLNKLGNKKGSLLSHDIGLLELERPVPWSAFPSIRPICLPESSNYNLSVHDGILTGWGATETDTTFIYDEQCELVRYDTSRSSPSDILQYITGLEWVLSNIGWSLTTHKIGQL